METTSHPSDARAATPRRASRKAMALVATAITGAAAVAGVVSAGSASAAELTTAKTLSPAVQAQLVKPYPLPFPYPGGCIVCGLGGFDPVFEDVFGPLLP